MTLERLSLEVVDVTHGESPYWYSGGSSCVFSSLRPANPFSWARIAPEKPFPILCNLPLTCISDHYATAESVWSSISRHSGAGTSAPEAPETRCCHICNRNAPSMSLNVGVTLCGYHERCRSTCAPA